MITAQQALEALDVLDAHTRMTDGSDAYQIIENFIDEQREDIGQKMVAFLATADDKQKDEYYGTERQVYEHALYKFAEYLGFDLGKVKT